MNSSLGVAFESLYRVVLRLASDDGCPWDSKQTVFTLIPKFDEECRELRKAAEDNDYTGIVEELGDLLYLICLSTAREPPERLEVETVISCLREKMIFKHPEQFRDRPATDSGLGGLVADGSASLQWQKEKERLEKRFRWGWSFCQDPAK